jgi:uncharacterized membrane protein
MSIAAMVLGICSFFVPYGGLVIAIVGLVLGILGKKKADEIGAPSKMAMTGIILSIIAIAWSVILVIICISCFAAIGSTAMYW